MTPTQGATAGDALPAARDADDALADTTSSRFALRRWLWQDSPYIAMLLLTVLGVILRTPVGYWLTLTPVFGLICVLAGWRQVEAPEDRVRLVYSQALIWLALVAAIFIMYSNGLQGVLTFSISTIQTMTLLALGTFVAGVQARAWRICAVGVVLFLTAPGVGWFEQLVLLLIAATVVIVAMGGVSWWAGRRAYAEI
ncbi:membrane protein of unknown function [Rhodovastum atsumiense]|uniref:hypothetical protein n=1 Tax=Rhodovastum atsumiense TaxID=504468 RepID=UPI00139F2AC1|nr:hypothetical protein [Rhodovastum atsumiense]CAH2601969.1 membrane protein of unknown function [Rhodovastum atsumiense]